MILHLLQKGQQDFRSIWPQVNSCGTQGEQFLQSKYFSSFKKGNIFLNAARWIREDLHNNRGVVKGGFLEEWDRDG